MTWSKLDTVMILVLVFTTLLTISVPSETQTVASSFYLMEQKYNVIIMYHNDGTIEIWPRRIFKWVKFNWEE